MASRGGIICCLFALCTAIILLVSVTDTSSGSFFKNGHYPQPYSYSIDTFPAQKSLNIPGIVVTERNNGEYIVTSCGQSINVSLMETGPHQNWILLEGKGAQCTGNDLIDTYPVRHIFRLKTNESSIIRFHLEDERSGETIKAFQFNLAVDGPLSGIGWPKFSGDLVPSFVWPIEQKF